MQVTVLLPDDFEPRIERIRRSAAFKKVPPVAALLRDIIAEGLARLEAQPTGEPRS